MAAFGGTLTLPDKGRTELQRSVDPALPDEDIRGLMCPILGVIAQDFIWQTNKPAQDLPTDLRAFHPVLRENKSR